MPGKIRVLFLAEAVTLAHVARPAFLARSLPQGQFELHFAHNPVYRDLLGQLPVQEHYIHSISPDEFKAKLSAGRRIYSESTLACYVEEDRALIQQVKPDVVVGDFRLSLSVSCRVERIPYVALSNAYWSSHIPVKFVVPELSASRIFGPWVAQKLFDLVRPLVFAHHSQPLNRLRYRFGLPSLGNDLRKVYTDADHTLFSDPAEMYDEWNLPTNQTFIGPLLWEPEIAAPEWLDGLPTERPLVYATMGSSGNPLVLEYIAEALAELPVTAVLSTAGSPVFPVAVDNLHVDEYVPGNTVAEKASLVICNGGSPTTQQALAAGIPVLGIASNLDQYLNMQAFVSNGLGLCLRSERVSSADVKEATRTLLADESFSRNAAAARMYAAKYNPREAFKAALTDLGVNS